MMGPNSIQLMDELMSKCLLESCMINVADIWREGNVWYLGRSVWYAPKGVTTTQSSTEHTEVSRGHSS